MNETIRQLYERKSVRAYEDRKIDEDIVQEILLAASMALSAGNEQLYTILRITDPKIKEQLAESCDHQPFIPLGEKTPASAGGEMNRQINTHGGRTFVRFLI